MSIYSELRPHVEALHLAGITTGERYQELVNLLIDGEYGFSSEEEAS